MRIGVRRKTEKEEEEEEEKEEEEEEEEELTLGSTSTSDISSEETVTDSGLSHSNSSMTGMLLCLKDTALLQREAYFF